MSNWKSYISRLGGLWARLKSRWRPADLSDTRSWPELPRRAGASAGKYGRTARPLLISGHIMRVAAGRARWWVSLSRRKRITSLVGVGLVGLVIAFGTLTWTGVQAALDARQAYRELEGELAHFTPVDLLQVNGYNSLEDRFREAEQASARARSRLAFLGAFQWVPVVGGDIKEVRLLLDMGYYQGGLP